MRIDVPPLADLFDDLVRVETRLYNALNDRLRSEHGLFASQFEFLRYLRDHPGSRVADLARHFVIGIGATSKGIARLESQGLVQRTPNPDDGRSSLLDLTVTGTGLVDAAERTFTAQLASLIGGSLDGAQSQRLAATLSELRSHLEATNVGTPAG